MKIHVIRRYLRLTSFDTSTEQGRSDERYRLAAWSIVINIFSKSLSLLVIMLSIRWTLPYLGVERFGAWMTIAGFVGMLIFLDLGVGNALINQVARAEVQGGKVALIKTVTGGLTVLFGLAVVAATVLTLLVSIMPWASLFKLNNLALRDEIDAALYVFSVLFGINLFSSGVQKIFVGLQRSFEVHAASMVASLLSLVSLWWAVRHSASISALLIATLGCQSAAGLFLLPLVRRREVFKFSVVKQALGSVGPALLKSGGLFLILQLGVMAGWGADSLIISSTLGLDLVATYVVVQRLFQLISQPLAMVNAPLWSAYADAHARKDVKFIRQTLKKSMGFTAAYALVGGGILVLASEQLVSWWSNGVVVVPLKLVAAFFLWTTCEAMGSAYSMMLNGCGVVREQVVTVMLLTGIGLPAKIILIHFAGVTGMLFGYTVLYVSLVLLMYGFVYKERLFARAF